MKEIKLIPRNIFKPTLIALISDEDYELISKYDWSYSKDSGRIRAHATINGKTVRMHKLLMPDPGKTVDHIDHNPLNNQRNNLRYATQQEQIINRRKSKNVVTSKYKGVYWNKINNKWIAQITYNCKATYLGSFENEKTAAKVYNRKAKELFGEFAMLNIIKE